MIRNPPDYYPVITSRKRPIVRNAIRLVGHIAKYIAQPQKMLMWLIRVMRFFDAKY